ncbi:hypothetical protein NHQ30_009889 [Ciborinia camelliae]|nr:hypothetical protein NHQ30_009889 [Ciborinia camelliae]
MVYQDPRPGGFSNHPNTNNAHRIYNLPTQDHSMQNGHADEDRVAQNIARGNGPPIHAHTQDLSVNVQSAAKNYVQGRGRSQQNGGGGYHNVPPSLHGRPLGGTSNGPNGSLLNVYGNGAGAGGVASQNIRAGFGAPVHTQLHRIKNWQDTFKGSYQLPKSIANRKRIDGMGRDFGDSKLGLGMRHRLSYWILDIEGLGSIRGLARHGASLAGGQRGRIGGGYGGNLDMQVRRRL